MRSDRLGDQAVRRLTPAWSASVMDEIEWRLKYETHLRSVRWRNLRREKLRQCGSRCERCGRRSSLQLHHKTYERLGRELMTDLEVVCIDCHKSADLERAEANARRAVNASYNAGLDTYATKKYGENWDIYRHVDDVAEEFDRWLDRRGEDW